MVSQSSTVVGGSDMVFLQEVALLDSAGYAVMPFCVSNDVGNELQDRFGRFFPAPVNFASPSLRDLVRYLYNWEARDKIEEAIASFKPDICHLHIYYGQISSAILEPLRRARVPCIQTLHEYRYICPVSVPFVNGSTCTKCSAGHYLSVLSNRCNRGSLARSGLSMLEMYLSDFLGAKKLAHYLCVSERQRRFLLDKGLSAERSGTLYNCINEDFYDDDSVRDIDVLYVGRLEKYKGIGSLISMARALPNRSFAVVGEGGFMVDAKAQSNDLPNIRFYGQMPQARVAAMMRRSRSLVVPSQWEETFGLISAEAMACGTPVIASRIGGIPEVVADGVAGFVVDPADIAGFCQRIATLLDSDTVWQAHSIAGKRRVNEMFSQEAHLAALIATYDRVICRQERPL